MPKLLPTPSDIMLKRGRDTCFLKFEFPYGKYPRRIDGNPYIQPILSWLDAQGISATLLGYDADAEDVLLEGFTGLYALSFDDFAGSTWLAFLRKFEDENGESRDPRAYNLTVVSFEGWTQAQAR